MRAVHVLTFFAAAGTMLAQHAFTPGDIEDGKRLFSTNCSGCHGAEGNGVAGVDLMHGKFRRATNDDEVAQIIRTGITGTAMPPGSYTEFQAGTIVAYLRSVAAAAATGGTAVIAGDAVNGKAVFEGKGNCVNCHRVRGKGSRFGPELTDIGSSRRPDALQKSILTPDADIRLENRSIRVVTKTGTTVSGRLLYQDVFAILLIDPKEQLRSFDRSDLKEATILDTKSPMPSFQGRLSAQEVADVVSYLGTLKGID